ncbi:SAF domain-containing protein [Microbacterium sediminis]|uniref:Uncharacterized protein n=1 Tax=Microbacterium sediminis TaxID=904291 RepID=A0A1B9NCQ5_9MICO|nr:SAF domain-containing protein [Microbacterium sediminis]OCG74363.1 hypothetical protein A7J15_05895 [Microbacterium sediminis]QBR73733.1 hypothetical protein E3O41_04380 [Microbacterium sediminis]
MIRKRAFWSDARFFVGIALIVVSVAGVWGVVAASRHTVPVLAASATIVPGQTVTASDLHVVDVGLGQVEGLYLTPEQLDEGVVAQRTIGEGELVPADAVGSSASVTTVVVRSAAEVPGAVDTGTAVELWEAPATEEGFDPPRVLVADATVAAIVRADGVMAAGQTSVELVVERADVGAVLAAVAAGSALSVVPTGGAG